MPPVLGMAGSALLIGATVAVVAVWARLHYARRLTSFRCRVGPPAARWRRRRARWRVRRTRASWVDDVLLLRSGALRLWLTPFAVGVAREVSVQELGPGEV